MMTGLTPASSPVVELPLSRASSMRALDDAMHDLAQPLTSLLFAVEMARMQTDPQAWRDALDNASVECTRAIAAFRRARACADGGA